MALAHHDLCYGCGAANLFGLQLELGRHEGGVAGRFFVKQDHQGAPGSLHDGVLAAALDDAMALASAVNGEAGEGARDGAGGGEAAGADARELLPTSGTDRLEVDFRGAAPVGAFVSVEARVERREEGRVFVSAAAFAQEGERPLAEARAVFREGER